MAKNKMKMTEHQKRDAILFWQNVQRLRRQCLAKQSQSKQPPQLTAIKQPQRSIAFKIFSRERRRELEAAA
jgi:hypothetical protein